MNRQAPAVTYAPIRTYFNQPLNIGVHFPALLAFDGVVAVNDFPQLGGILLGQLVNAYAGINAHLFNDLLSASPSDPIDVG